jgi:hypothetical protein
MSAEFHIFASSRDTSVELELPDNVCRIAFLSIAEAARHARTHQQGKGGTAVIHDDDSSMVNRIPL